MLRYSLLALLLAAVILTASPLRADWINLSGAETSPNIMEVYVEENRVRLVLEVYVGDLEVFEDLVPDSFLKRKNPSRASPAERIHRFSSQSLRVVTETGEALPATLLKVEPRLRKERFSPFAGMVNPITRRRVAKPPADKRVLYAELSYKFGQVRPKTLGAPHDHAAADDRGREVSSRGEVLNFHVQPDRLEVTLFPGDDHLGPQVGILRRTEGQAGHFQRLGRQCCQGHAQSESHSDDYTTEIRD